MLTDADEKQPIKQRRPTEIKECYILSAGFNAHFTGLFPTEPAAAAENLKGLTSNRGTGGPRRDGVSPLIEQDVGSTCAHLPLRNRLSTAVVIAVPLAVNRVPTEG